MLSEEVFAEEAAEAAAAAAASASGSGGQQRRIGDDYGTTAMASGKAETKKFAGIGNGPRLPSTSGNDSDGKGDSYGGFKESPPCRRPSVFWLLPAFTLYMTAFGTVIVPKLNIILELICREYHAESHLISSKETTCQESADVQQLVARFVLYMNLVSGFLSVITSPWLGAFSDRYGRRIILMTSSSGLLVGEILVVLAAKFPDTFSVNIMLLGNVIDGLCGSFLLGMNIAHAYAADCTSVANRGVNFGYFHGAIFLGLSLGPFIGGYIIERSGNVLLVFYLAMAAHVIFILYAAFILPESMSKRRMEKARENHALEKLARGDQPLLQKFRSWNPFQPLSIFWPTGSGSSSRVRLNLVVLAGIDVLFFGVPMAASTIIIMYAEYKFKWHNYESSIFVSIINCTRTSVLFIIMPLVIYLIRRYTTLLKVPGTATSITSQPKHIGATMFDIYLIRFAVVAEIIGYLGYSRSNYPTTFILSGMFTALGGVGAPTVESCMTKHVPSHKVGQLLGATTLLHSAVRIISPLVVNSIYSATVKTFPQVIFICLAGAFFLAVCFTWFVTPHICLHEDEHGNMIDSHVDGETREEGHLQEERESLLRS